MHGFSVISPNYLHNNFPTQFVYKLMFVYFETLACMQSFGVYIQSHKNFLFTTISRRSLRWLWRPLHIFVCIYAYTSARIYLWLTLSVNFTFLLASHYKEWMCFVFAYLVCRLSFTVLFNFFVIKHLTFISNSGF